MKKLNSSDGIGLNILTPSKGDVFPEIQFLIVSLEGTRKPNAFNPRIISDESRLRALAALAIAS
jgi:hypothetical protein